MEASRFESENYYIHGLQVVSTLAGPKEGHLCPGTWDDILAISQDEWCVYLVWHS